MPSRHLLPGAALCAAILASVIAVGASCSGPPPVVAAAEDRAGRDAGRVEVFMLGDGFVRDSAALRMPVEEFVLELRLMVRTRLRAGETLPALDVLVPPTAGVSTTADLVFLGDEIRKLGIPEMQIIPLPEQPSEQR